MSYLAMLKVFNKNIIFVGECHLPISIINCWRKDALNIDTWIKTIASNYPMSSIGVLYECNSNPGPIFFTGTCLYKINNMMDIPNVYVLPEDIRSDISITKNSFNKDNFKNIQEYNESMNFNFKILSAYRRATQNSDLQLLYNMIINSVFGPIPPELKNYYNHLVQSHINDLQKFTIKTLLSSIKSDSLTWIDDLGGEQNHDFSNDTFDAQGTRLMETALVVFFSIVFDYRILIKLYIENFDVIFVVSGADHSKMMVETLTDYAENKVVLKSVPLSRCFYVHQKDVPQNFNFIF